MKKIIVLALSLAGICAYAQPKGSISSDMLKEIESSYKGTSADKECLEYYIHDCSGRKCRECSDD